MLMEVRSKVAAFENDRLSVTYSGALFSNGSAVAERLFSSCDHT